MQDRHKLSAFVIAYNRAAMLRTCLAALGFADEIVVIDKSSTDETQSIAAAHADRVITVPWTPTVEETRAFALTQCTHDWVLCLDDDECLSPEAVRFIDAELYDPRAEVYDIPQRHYILGRHDPRAYYWPEAHPKLFRKGRVAYTATVHGGVHVRSERRFLIPAETGACIHHLSHHDAAEWIAKANRYTDNPDRHRAEDLGEDLIGFAHRQLDHWRARSGDPAVDGYTAAVALLRAVYDMIDRAKTWEERAGPGGATLFPAIRRNLEASYLAELADLARQRRPVLLRSPVPIDPVAERHRRALDAVGEALAAARETAARASALHHAIATSTCWRLTAPLRGTVEMVRALVSRLRLAPRPAPPRQAPPPLTAPATQSWTLPPIAAAPEVSIIIPTYGALPHTLRCLAAIARNPPVAPIEIIVVDDAFGGPDSAALAAIPNIRLVINETNVGYLRTTNAAARLARGRYLCLLNNDTEAQEGWLDSMLALLRARPEAAAVGAKLLFPDGRLQEAGGIIWNDGTGWTVGRGDDPDAPEHDYVREVDYVSGATLLIRADIFAALGGFDERYAPAYCEDSDLAFRVRAAGLKVLYQPRARVIHHEGVSHGLDHESGVRRFNAINQVKLRARWSDTLAAEHFAPFTELLRARERGHDRNVLLAVAGTLAEAGSLVPLARAGFVLKVWAFLPGGPAEALRQDGIEVRTGDHAALRQWLARNGAGLDRVLLFPRDAPEAAIPDLRFASQAMLACLALRPSEIRPAWRHADLVLHVSGDVPELPSGIAVRRVSLDPGWPAAAWRAALDLPDPRPRQSAPLAHAA